MCNNKIFRGNKSHRLLKKKQQKKNRCRLQACRLRWKKFVFMFSPSYDYVKHNVMDTSLVFLQEKKVCTTLSPIASARSQISLHHH